MDNLSIPNTVTSIGEYAFYGCSSLTSVDIPNSVKNIGESAFEGCSNLSSLSIGYAVNKIDKRAFAKCTNLEDVYCYIETPLPQGTSYNNQHIYSNAFDGSYIEYAKLHVPATSLEAYKTTAPWSDFGSIVAIEEDNAIVDILADDSSTQYYTIDGKHSTNKTNGFFIVKNENGSVQKVLLK